MILFKAEAIFASGVSNFGELLAATDRDWKIRTSSHLVSESYLPI